MRIVFLTSKLNFISAGGSVLDLHQKAMAMRDRGHDVTVVTAFSDANKMSEPAPYRVREERVRSRRLFGIQLGAYRILRRYEKDADCFYVDGQNFFYGGAWYRFRGGRVPVVAFFNMRLDAWRDVPLPMDSVRRTLERGKRAIRAPIERAIGSIAARWLDRSIYTTPFVRQWYRDAGFPDANADIIPDFVNTADIILKTRRTPEARASFHRLSDTAVFLASGRMVKEKGFDLLVRAIAMVPRECRARFIVCGDGPERESVRNLARHLGALDRVEFPGWVPKETLQKFFEIAHAFILPKWHIEYTSVLLIEAMAYGMPCIVPAGGGAAWLAGAAALTFRNDSPEELAERVTGMAGNPDVRIQLSLEAERIAPSYDCCRLAASLERVMTEAVARNTG